MKDKFSFGFFWEKLFFKNIFGFVYVVYFLEKLLNF